MTFQVWHRRLPTFMESRPEELVAFPQGWQHVADVDVDALNQVFERTNSIDALWTDNLEVTLRVAPPLRSTSVGDVIVAPNAVGLNGQPARLEIAMLGYKEF